MTPLNRRRFLKTAGGGALAAASWRASLAARQSPDTAEIVVVEKSGEMFELEEQMRRLLVDVPARTPLVSAAQALPSQKICLEIERALAERRAIALRWP